jgi:hypothetical protein
VKLGIFGVLVLTIEPTTHELPKWTKLFRISLRQQFAPAWGKPCREDRGFGIRSAGVRSQGAQSYPLIIRKARWKAKLEFLILRKHPENFFKND